MQILKGHVSPETAYVIADYPYGFRLRCAKRYWLDCDERRGVRLMSQTSNPKRPGLLVWNAVKASVYCRFGGAMYLDEDGHVQWSGLTEYSSAADCLAWRETYGAGVPEPAREMLSRWVAAKVAYSANREKGDPLRVGLAEAVRAFGKAEDEETR